MQHAVLMHINEVKRPTVERRQWSRGSTKPWTRGKQNRCRRDTAAPNDSLQVHQCRKESANVVKSAPSRFFFSSFLVSEGFCWDSAATQKSGQDCFTDFVDDAAHSSSPFQVICDAVLS